MKWVIIILACAGLASWLFGGQTPWMLGAIVFFLGLVFLLSKWKRISLLWKARRKLLLLKRKMKKRGWHVIQGGKKHKM